MVYFDPNLTLIHLTREEKRQMVVDMWEKKKKRMQLFSPHSCPWDHIRKQRRKDHYQISLMFTTFWESHYVKPAIYQCYMITNEVIESLPKYLNYVTFIINLLNQSNFHPQNSHILTRIYIKCIWDLKLILRSWLT